MNFIKCSENYPLLWKNKRKSSSEYSQKLLPPSKVCLNSVQFISHKNYHFLISFFSPRYLLELDCDGDPAWDCITAMHQWLLRLLFSSKEEYQALPARDSTEDLSSQGVDAEAPPAIPPRSRSKAGSVGPFGEGHQRTMSDVSYASSVSSQASQSMFW